MNEFLRLDNYLINTANILYMQYDEKYQRLFITLKDNEIIYVKMDNQTYQEKFKGEDNEE